MNSWLETPYVSSTDSNYYTHYLYRGDSNVEDSSLGRNYSFYWSASGHVSLWLAYPLYGEWAESKVQRKDSYGSDPLIDPNQQASSGGYSKYTRGHQIPSADRLSSRAMNNSVFYMTNITPQESSFNSGVWGTLEQRVRSWADSSDEFYVVTGCLISDNGTTVTSNGLDIAVPTHYYKALLRKKGGSYTACAYIYSHFNSNKSFSESDRISIDALENQTGIDFFPNLIGVLGETEAARIESTATAF
ncbi:MAG: DNA/RNA non-specific endonuclease [Bacteroidales bacterium]|nr:DNA/RNA non-specific endonuclease [Bacteroidales bacterium]